MLLKMSFKEALVFADKDIRDRWGMYLQRFLRGGLAVTKFERLNSVLGYEFDRYVMEHPDFAEKIPPGAIVVLQVEGEDDFNKGPGTSPSFTVAKRSPSSTCR